MTVLPRSSIFHTPASAVDEARRCVFSFLAPLTSFSVEAGGFSSCMERPAMAESTLVRGTVMVVVVGACWNEFPG